MAKSEWCPTRFRLRFAIRQSAQRPWAAPRAERLIRLVRSWPFAMIRAVQIARTIADVRSAVARARGENRSIALVPTMGALHSGHVSLIDSARRKQRDDGSENSDGTRPFVVVTIFVNPTQFAPHEDFSRYPRDEAGDLRACESAGADLAFLPGVDEMYPADARTHIHVAQLTDTLCGPFRPGHFDGVATVVAKLFNIVRPDVAYFGRKDAQQLAVIRRVVRDLDFPGTRWLSDRSRTRRPGAQQSQPLSLARTAAAGALPDSCTAPRGNAHSRGRARRRTNHLRNARNDHASRPKQSRLRQHR